MKKWPIPIEVSFRTFVAITFAGSIFFHVVGLGLHSYLNGQKKALIGKIESLAEAESKSQKSMRACRHFMRNSFRVSRKESPKRKNGESFSFRRD